MRKYLKVLLLILLAVINNKILSQQTAEMRVVGTPKAASGEIIVRSQENIDANGEYASGILIVSDLVGLTYDANNGFVKDVKHRGAGEDLLFVSPSERKITVYAAGYKPLELFLLNLGVRLEKYSSLAY